MNFLGAKCTEHVVLAQRYGCQTGCHRHSIMANLSSCFAIGLQRLSPQDFNVAGQYHWRTIQTPKLPTTLGIPGDSVLHTIPGTPATSGVHLSKDAFAAGTNSLAYGFRACTIWMVHGWWMIHRYTDHCTPRSIACAATVCVSTSKLKNTHDVNQWLHYPLFSSKSGHALQEFVSFWSLPRFATLGKHKWKNGIRGIWFESPKSDRSGIFIFSKSHLKQEKHP